MTPQKKETLEKILKALTPYRDMAEWFLSLLDNNEDENIMDSLYDIITNEIKKINNENDRENIKKSLKKIKEQEEKEREEENEYLENLINNI